MLQKVGRSEGGVYTCTAHNSEGDGVSNSMSLDVKCKFMYEDFRHYHCDITLR